MANIPEPPRPPAGRLDPYVYYRAVNGLSDVDARAEALLRDHLDPRQAADYGALGAFGVRGAGGNEYVIDRVGRVFGNGLYLCVGSTDPYLPHADAVLGLKLFIEASEEEFLRLANVGGHPAFKLAATGDLLIGGVPRPIDEVPPQFRHDAQLAAVFFRGRR